MSNKQKTLKSPISFEGVGLHTGVYTKMTIKPAPENTGYIFKRIDQPEPNEILAVADNVADTSRSTTIENKNIKVITIEHVLASLYGMGIDNALIELDNIEVPILTGNAKPYIDKILEVGIITQNTEKEYYVIKKSITFSDEEKGNEFVTFPDDSLTLNVLIDYNSTVLGHQYATLNNIEEFPTEIAPAKTFVFFRELEYLYDHNLIKGGSLENALVIVEKESTQEDFDRLADKLGRPRVKYKGRGILNDQDLLFNNEPARHKLLDLLGDLALIGVPIKGKILAKRPGHSVNVDFVKKLRQDYKARKLKGDIPEIDPTIEPIYDINKIRKILPHRPPFLLVDKVMTFNENSIIAVKNVTMNEPFFVGHFPEEPVMPGVLIVEAIAQAGGILVLSGVDEPEKYSTYFLKINNVKFRKKVIPGDTLIFRCTYLAPVKRGIVTMHGEAFVGQDLVCDGEFTAQIVKNK